MFDELRLQNFQGFRGEHVAPLAPITLIFGPNSSGKSALLRALVMLAQSASTPGATGEPLAFRGSLLDLGGYRAVINGHELSRPLSIGFSYRHGGSQSAASRPRTPSHVGVDFGLSWDAAAGAPSLGSLSFRGTADLTTTFVPAEPELLEDLFEPSGSSDMRIAVDPRLITWFRDRALELQDRFAGDDIESQRLRELDRQIEALTAQKSALEAEFAALQDMQQEATARVSQLHAELADLRRLETEQARSPELVRSLTQRIARVNEELSRMTSRERDVDGRLLDAKAAMQASVLEQLAAVRAERNHLAHAESAVGSRAQELLGSMRFSTDGFMPVREISVERESTSGKLSRRVLSQVSSELLGQVRFARDALSTVRYLGPLRSAPTRIEIGDVPAQSYVGVSGGSTAAVLGQKQATAQRTNEWLRRMDIPYRVSTRQVSNLDYPSLGDLRTLVLEDTRTGVQVAPTDVGFGMSQILPVIVQSLLGEGQRQTLVVEQPEIHLHPRLQAELGDLFVEVTRNGPCQVVAETHSETLMLRVQRRIREGRISHKRVSVLYVGASEDQGSWIMPIPINAKGQFEEEWPEGFFEERYEEWIAE